MILNKGKILALIKLVISCPRAQKYKC